MPDKLLKDGLRTSEKIGAASLFAELLFIRLLLATCPLGRCPWRPDWILAHALPNRPHTRLTTIEAALLELRALHLVTRYEHDGDAYLTIPRHGQRFKHAVRSPWPPPPTGPSDAEGQTFMAIAEEPPPEPAATPPGIGKKQKASVRVSAITHFSSGLTSEKEGIQRGGDQRPAADCIAELQAMFPRHDIAAQLRAATRYVRRTRGEESEVTAAWFLVHWMPKAAERKTRPTPAPAPVATEASTWAAQQQARLAAVVDGEEPPKGTLEHAIWLEGRAAS